MNTVRHSLEIDGRILQVSAWHRPGPAGPRSGDLVVFLHGLGCAKESFRDAPAATPLENFTLFIPDLPGFGDSPPAEGVPCSMEFLARTAEALIDRIPHSRIHLVAHSMGGAVGLLLADRLAAAGRPPTTFVNVEGNLIAEDCGMLSRDVAEATLERFEATLFPELMKRFAGMEGRYLAFTRASPRALHEAARSLVALSDDGGLLRRFLDLPCEKAYIHGDANGHLAVIRRLESMHRIAIPDSGHCPQNDNPDAFHRAVAGVLCPAAGTRILTLGHSSRTAEEFLALAASLGVRAVADVRRFPSSRKFPQFNRGILEKTLADRGIAYRWFEDLGGLRKGDPQTRSLNTAITDPAFRRYTDHMQSAAFAEAAGRLLAFAMRRRTAVLCAEKDPAHCHRRYLSDFLVARGARVVHVLDENRTRIHRLGPYARVTDDGKVIYPSPLFGE